MSKKSKVSSKKGKQKGKDRKPEKKNKKAAAPNKKVKKTEKKASKAKKSSAKPASSHKTAKKASPKKPGKAVAKKSSTSKGAKAPAKKPNAPVKSPAKNAKAIAPASKAKNIQPIKKEKSTGKPAASTPAKSTSRKEIAPKTEGPVHSVFSKPSKVTPEVLAVQNTLPVKNKQEISPSRIASISSSITNPSRKPESYSIKPEKEPSGKFEMEFVIHASAEMLYEFLSTPSGLSEWFCDDLNIRNGIYTFIWDDQLMQARLLKTSEQQLVRFQWVDKTDGSYFEFRIQKDDLTNDISLIITDFADTSSERESAKLLWQSQIEKLRHVIGSIF